MLGSTGKTVSMTIVFIVLRREWAELIATGFGEEAAGMDGRVVNCAAHLRAY